MTGEIVFVKGATRRYRSVLHRADGVEVELDGGAYNRVGGPAREVPHDIAHLIVEDELGLERGVWGVLAAGGLFRGASILAGRQRPHAARHAGEILAAAVEQLNQAEVLVRVACDLSLVDRPDPHAARGASGDRWWSDAVTADALRACFARLRDAGAAWSALSPGDHLTGRWPR
ncbi:MAG: hypothetical protein JHC84_04425 [Solirubrobacteraceae bacterium]|nr:hypothetical protein [Solirubrobacteraceae bacterium]